LKKIFVLFLFISEFVLSQVAPTKYWIHFNDKNGTPYSISDPAPYLSAKAMERRNKQSIAIEENDLPITPSYIKSVLSVGVTILNRSKWLNAVTIQTSDTNKLNMIKSFPFVSGAKPVGIWKGKNDVESYTKSVEAKTSSVSKATGYEYGFGTNQITMVGGDCIHNKGFHGEEMVITVIDAGFIYVDILPAFDSLRANNQILGTWDFVDNDSTVYANDSHGTFVLSVMAANLPDQLVGTAPKAKYWLLRSENNAGEFIMEEDNWVSAAEFADSVGTDVINTSLGYNTFDNPAYDHTYSEMDGNTTHISIAADIAASKGIGVVNSAGNEGGLPWHYILCPADGDSVLAVGAVSSDRSFAGFSSRGPSSDGGVKPNIAAQGVGVATTNLTGSGWIQTNNGTSFAAPIIAGMFACLWQANPTKNNMEIFNAIQQSASHHQAPDSLTGYGIPNFCIADLLLTGAIPKNPAGDSLFNLLPVPFTNSFEFSFYSLNAQVVKVELFDIAGKKIISEEKITEPNSYNNYDIVQLDLIAKGIYILRISTDNKIYRQKMLKY
jgi:serine protease AprX